LALQRHNRKLSEQTEKARNAGEEKAIPEQDFRPIADRSRKRGRRWRKRKKALLAAKRQLATTRSGRQLALEKEALQSRVPRPEHQPKLRPRCDAERINY